MCKSCSINHVEVPMIKCECGSEWIVHRNEIRDIQQKYDVSFEVARYLFSTIVLLEQSEMPEKLGPVRVTYDNDGEFKVTVDLTETRKASKPTKAPVKKRTTLRDAIKSAAKVAKTESEDTKTAPDRKTTNAPNAQKSKKKYTGKSKTFKRKTKRPGRI